jgi:magnesium-transporting ATPase (P-type)
MKKEMLIIVGLFLMISLVSAHLPIEEINSPEFETIEIDESKSNLGNQIFISSIIVSLVLITFFYFIKNSKLSKKRKKQIFLGIVLFIIIIILLSVVFYFNKQEKERKQTIYGSGFELNSCEDITEKDIYELCLRIYEKDKEEFEAVLLTNKFHQHIGPNNIYGTK